MKYILGIFYVAIILFIALYGILWMYGVPVFQPELFYKLLITMAVIVIVAILLTILIPFFFAPKFRNYNTNEGKVAHPKKESEKLSTNESTEKNIWKEK